MVWVDGAYDRKAAASPWVTDATVCVVGAAMGRSLDLILQRTEEMIRLLTLPEARNPLVRSAAEIARSNNSLVGMREGRHRGVARIFPVVGGVGFGKLWPGRVGRDWPCPALLRTGGWNF